MYTVSSTLSTAIANGTPQRVLLEFTKKPDGTAYSPVVQFSNEDVLVESGVEMDETFNSDTDLTIGKCPSAEIRFDLLNDAGQLSNFEFGTFKAWLGARIDSGTPPTGAKTRTFAGGKQPGLYEFTPLGVFIAKRPNIVKKKILSIEANDQMTLFDANMPSASDLGLTYPTTLYALYEKLCLYLGVPYKTTAFMNSTLTVSAEPEQFKDATMREVLGWIAEAACSIARFDRDGQLEMAWFNPVSAVYDEHNYSDFSPYWYATKAIDGLHVRNANSEAEAALGQSTNNYLIQDNPFLRVADTPVGGGAS